LKHWMKPSWHIGLDTVAAAGVEPGDEVITSAYSFHASASCILHHNGIPIFADIDPKTFNIDPKKVEEKIIMEYRYSSISTQKHSI